jgi:hypothetical protein
MTRNQIDRDRQLLADFRRQLLDLSLRNPLLNRRPSRRRGLEIIAEDPAQISAWFIEDDKPFVFHATRPPSRPLVDDDEADPADAAAEPATESPDPDAGLDDREDSLATPYAPEELQRRLEHTARDARLFYQERGVGALFLAIGVLRWYESPASDQERSAPLILIPVRLDRRSARARWRLERTEEDLGVNLSLAEKLREFGLCLPEPETLDDWPAIAGYLAALREVVTGQPDPRWEVDDRGIALDFFNFARFLMWKDLDPAAWPGHAALLDHRIVQGLLGAGFREAPDPLAGGPADLDAARQPLGTFYEVLDCDSSQAEVMAQVCGRAQPGRARSARHRQEPDHRQPDRGCSRTRTDGALRRREDGRAAGGGQPHGAHRPGRAVPGTAFGQGVQAGARHRPGRDPGDRRTG